MGTYLISQRFSPPLLFAITLPSLPDSTKKIAAFNEVILWIRINREDLLNNCYRYCSPLPTQVMNSSYHATRSEDGCTHFTRLAAAAAKSYNHLEPQFCRFGHVCNECDAWIFRF